MKKKQFNHKKLRLKKKTNFTILVVLFLTMFSCTNDLDENVEIAEAKAITETVEPKLIELSITSLSEINDPLLSNQFSNTVNQIKEIISSESGKLMAKHNLNDLVINEDNVMVGTKTDGSTSYIFSVNIPSKNTKEEQKLHTYVTLNFDANGNLNNHLQIGAEQLIYFDSKGSVLTNNTNNAKYGYYSPKPSNKPSKAPKSVLCNYNWNGNAPSVVASYCGFFGGSTGPAPIEVLAAMFPEWYVYSNGQWIELSSPRAIIPLTNDYNDLYYITSNGNLFPFMIFYVNGFPSLKNEIINYYGQVYITQLGYALTNPYSQTYEEDHIHKQAFLDSFIEWIYEMQNQSPTNYNYLTANPDVLYDIFNFFAEYNLNNPINEYTYLGQPWYIWQYAPNPDVKCMNTGAEFLKTPAGLLLMQQLGSGAITIEGFRAGLPDC
ncbi:hypothetical protein [Kordia jejudonensis]|uniref:hypothetical protein n=1 Tax=Kordia jejudonensis TaxID=1348245 RepID=UPI0006295B08|nr:hypothetical protein [Kordia jejudonensis]